MDKEPNLSPFVMQPPRMSAHLRDSLDRLQKKAEAQASGKILDEQSQKLELSKAEKTQADYVLLIKKWYALMPPAARQRRYTSNELITAFTGRYRDRPALRMIAAALRINGFTEHRDWTRAGRNQRYWLPPKDKNA